MEVDLTASNASRKSRPWMEVTLITGFVFSLLIGLGALIALVAASQQETLSITTPALETLNPQQIVPQLALAQLAGDPGEALAYQASSAGELDTAIAIALTSTAIDGPNRLSLLLRLSEDALAADRMDEGRILLNLARAVAVLDPSIAGTERSLALTQISEGFRDAGDDSAALDAGVQSMRSTEQTPGLLPAHRSELYEDLRPMAADLDDASFSQQLLELSRNPYFEPGGILLNPRLASIAPFSSSDPALVDAYSNRMLAARILTDRINLTGGIDIAPETQALAAALLREDQTRNEFYQRILSEGLSLPDQYALLLDRRNWIALKLRVALLGYGLSLVPEWEQNQQSLKNELGSATANIHLVAEALANELADPVEQASLRVESLLWLAQQAELDLYPDASKEELNDKLQAGQSELSRLGSPLALPVTFEQQASPPGFRILSNR